MSKKLTAMIGGLCLGFGLIVGVLVSNGEEDTRWQKALSEGGIIRPGSIEQVLALPTEMITMDSTGTPRISPQIVIKEEKDGEPYAAALYEVKWVLFSNLPVPDTTEVEK